jgi:lysophospholipase L1-like esterase
MRKPIQNFVIAFALFFMLGAGVLHAQGTAFTYQGQLNFKNGPANGVYNFTFTLYATNTGGAPVTGPVTNIAIGVSNGLFIATIDFGNAFGGGGRWLEIGVETNGASGFTVLAPRQSVTPVPYAITAGNVTGSLALAQLPAAVVTNGAAGLNLAGSFSGSGSFTSLSVGSNFVVDASGNVIAANLSIPATVASMVTSVNVAPNSTNYQFYPLDITASNFVVLGTAIIANPVAPSDFISSPQTGVTNGVGVDPPSWSLAFGIDGSNFVFQTLDAGQGTIISVDGHDATPAITLPSDGSQSYVQVNLSAPGYHWIILKNINNAFGIYAPVTNGFFSTPPVAYNTLAIMGDSFEDITPTNTYADYLAEVVPALNVCKFGEGGTGWWATQNPDFGYTNFMGRLADMKKVNPAYIIFAGGINDHTFAGANSNAYYQIVYNTAVAARAAYPNAHFAVVSPFWPRSPADSDVYVTATIISNACVTAGLINSNQFFNILSPPLVTGNQAIPNSGTADQYTSADTTHPTPKGAAAIAHWLAGKMAVIWPQLFYAAPTQ